MDGAPSGSDNIQVLKDGSTACKDQETKAEIAGRAGHFRVNEHRGKLSRGQVQESVKYQQSWK